MAVSVNAGDFLKALQPADNNNFNDATNNSLNQQASAAATQHTQQQTKLQEQMTIDAQRQNEANAALKKQTDTALIAVEPYKKIKRYWTEDFKDDPTDTVNAFDASLRDLGHELELAEAQAGLLGGDPKQAGKEIRHMISLVESARGGDTSKIKEAFRVGQEAEVILRDLGYAGYKAVTPHNVGDGAVAIDPNTGKPIFENEKDFAPSSSSSGAPANFGKRGEDGALKFVAFLPLDSPRISAEGLEKMTSSGVDTPDTPSPDRKNYYTKNPDGSMTFFASLNGNDPTAAKTIADNNLVEASDFNPNRQPTTSQGVNYLDSSGGIHPVDENDPAQMKNAQAQGWVRANNIDLNADGGAGQGFGAGGASAGPPQVTGEVGVDVTKGADVLAGSTGPGSTIMRGLEIFPLTSALVDGSEEVHSNHVMEQLNKNFKAATADNERYAIGEMRDLGETLARVEGGFFTSEEALRQRLSTAEAQFAFASEKAAQQFKSKDKTTRRHAEEDLRVLSGTLQKIRQILGKNAGQPTVTNQEQYDALAPGTRYMDSKGRFAQKAGARPQTDTRHLVN